mgnify:CR=1 FL=1
MGAREWEGLGRQWLTRGAVAHQGCGAEDCSVLRCAVVWRAVESCGELCDGVARGGWVVGDTRGGKGEVGSGAVHCGTPWHGRGTA